MEPLLVWLLVGLVAGVLASVAVGGGGFGIIGDIVIGILGAFIGGWLFRYMHWHTFHGIAGAIFVAFVGAALLLFAVRLIHSGTRRVRY